MAKMTLHSSETGRSLPAHASSRRTGWIKGSRAQSRVQIRRGPSLDVAAGKQALETVALRCDRTQVQLELLDSEPRLRHRGLRPLAGRARRSGTLQAAWPGSVSKHGRPTPEWTLRRAAADRGSLKASKEAYSRACTEDPRVHVYDRLFDSCVENSSLRLTPTGSKVTIVRRFLQCLQAGIEVRLGPLASFTKKSFL